MVCVPAKTLPVPSEYVLQWLFSCMPATTHKCLIKCNSLMIYVFFNARNGAIICGCLCSCEALEELEVSECQIGRLGAVALAKCAASKSALKKLNLNGNMIPAEGVEEVQEIFSSAACGQDALGSLSENDEVYDNDFFSLHYLLCFLLAGNKFVAVSVAMHDFLRSRFDVSDPIARDFELTATVGSSNNYYFDDEYQDTNSCWGMCVSVLHCAQCMFDAGLCVNVYQFCCDDFSLSVW